MAYTDTQYSDLLRAVNQYGSAYNYGNYSSFVNPYSGAAYSPVDYREIISRKTAPVDPRSAFIDYKPSFAGSLATGSLGHQIGSKGLTPAVQGMVNQGTYTANLANRFPDLTTGQIASKAASRQGLGATGLTTAAALYGATRDQNPYEQSTVEQLGTVGSSALAGASIGGMVSAGSAAGPIGAIVGLLAGLYINNRQKQKAADLSTEAGETFQEERTEYTEDIAKEAEEQREQYALGTEADLWGQEASKYSNQYGAYANPYGQSYYDKGGKMKLYNGGGGYTQDVYGCTDSYASNYNPQATMDDMSCVYPTPGDLPPDDVNPDTLFTGDYTDAEGNVVDINNTSMPNTWTFNPTERRIIKEPSPYESPIQRLTKEKAPIPELIEKPILPKSTVYLNDRRQATTSDDLEDYRWDLENPYIRENVDIFNEGGKLTRKEKSKLKKLGRKGDTELVHVNPKEKAMLEAMGGSGTTNPYTGLLEYHMKGFGHSLSHLAELAVSPALFLGDVFGGTEDPLGRQLDRMTLGYTSVGEPTGTAVFNDETGAWERETSDPNVTIGFDPTGEKIGSAGLYGETPTGTGSITGQAVSGTGWGYNTPAYEGASPRNPVQRIKPEDKIKVVNPFKSDFAGPEGENQDSALGLESYRWDLANPYIRENVDIFDEGGVVSQSESLPVDSMFNRQLFAESSFNPSAVSSAGALGLSQITEPTFNDMIGWGWVPEGKEFSDLKTDTDLAVNLQERYMNDLMTREWNQGSEDVVKAKALAAYNMGPTGLVKKLNKLKADGVDIYNNLDWINQLNSETTDYVNKIMLGGSEKFEQEYTDAWKSGGKEYDQGGITNTVAEFTGNELIINNQSAVEAGIKENNPSKAAAPIRLAMQKGFVTPGQETHGGNPMPVDDKGFIYTKGGKLPFRVRKNAGIYDHATDQFKQDMTDEQIMAVAKKNMNKWEKNNMN